MNSSDYNKFLAAIKAANNREPGEARELLRRIQAELIARYSLSDSDVDYLIRQFRYNI